MFRKQLAERKRESITMEEPGVTKASAATRSIPIGVAMAPAIEPSNQRMVLQNRQKQRHLNGGQNQIATVNSVINYDLGGASVMAPNNHQHSLLPPIKGSQLFEFIFFTEISQFSGNLYQTGF